MIQRVDSFGNPAECDLDMTSKKITELCRDELHVLSVTGVLQREGRLRAILLTAALLLRIDIQELESLNSVLKVALQRAGTTRISLELLSSRVCIRKTIASQTGSSHKLSVVKPIAATMANNLYLVWPNVSGIVNDLCRWAPSSDERVPANDIQKWNPSVLPTRSQKWAQGFNKQFIKFLSEFQSENAPGACKLALVVPQILQTQEGIGVKSWRLFMAGERPRSIVMLVELSHSQKRCATTTVSIRCDNTGRSLESMLAEDVFLHIKCCCQTIFVCPG